MKRHPVVVGLRRGIDRRGLGGVAYEKTVARLIIIELYPVGIGMVRRVQQGVGEGGIVQVGRGKSGDQRIIRSPDTVGAIDAVFIRAVGGDGVQVAGFGPGNEDLAVSGICFQHTHMDQHRRAFDEGAAHLFGGQALRAVLVHPHDHIAVIGTLLQSLTVVIIHKKGIAACLQLGDKGVTDVPRHAGNTTVGRISRIAALAVDAVSSGHRIARRPGQTHEIAARMYPQVARRQAQHTYVEVGDVHQTEITVVIPRLDHHLVRLVPHMHRGGTPEKTGGGVALAPVEQGEGGR